MVEQLWEGKEEEELEKEEEEERKSSSKQTGEKGKLKGRGWKKGETQRGRGRQQRRGFREEYNYFESGVGRNLHI